MAQEFKPTTDPSPNASIERRSLLKLPLALAAIGWSSDASAQTLLTSPFSIGEGPPNTSVPPLACDSHIHIFDPAFPPANERLRGKIDNATPQEYRKFQARIGTQRVVVVTPSTYGVDNRATLSGLKFFGNGARGVIVIDSDAPPADLDSLTKLGVRGIRVNFVTPQSWGVTTAERLKSTANIAAKFGWHIQIYARSSQVAELESVIAALPTPVMIDHLASVTPQEGLNSPGHTATLRLLGGGNIWLKLSGPYYSTHDWPTYAAIDPVAQSYVQAAPDSLVWGSDWPHRGQRNPFPDDAILFDILAKWAPDERTRKRILVDNPAKFYAFT